MSHRAQRAVLICIDPWTLEECEMRPFSYAIRKIQAAAVGDPSLSHWDIEVLDLRTASIDAFLPRIEALQPDLVGVSAYCWSFPTFVELSRLLKAKRPDLSIVFGGPSARLEMFNIEPFRDGPASIDALVLGEGEDTFRRMLALGDRSRTSLCQVPGLAVSTGNGWTLTPPAPLPDLDSLASPYVLKLIGGDRSDKRASAHLETFRGCPFSCSFCQWGDLSGKSNRAFSTEYLIRELSAFQELDLRHALIIDAALNLNHRAFRSLVAAEREVGFFRQSHLLAEVYPAHITDEHIEFVAAAQDATLAIGVQSLDKEVLDGVERPFNEARFRRVVKDLLSVAPRTTIELIVGLPGDNPTRFRETLDSVFELGCGVRVYRCLVLPGALMTRAPASFEMSYDLNTLRMQSCLGWSRDELEGMLSELADRVAAAGNDQAMILDGGNTFGFNPPLLHARDWQNGQAASETLSLSSEISPESQSPAEADLVVAPLDAAAVSTVFFGDAPQAFDGASESARSDFAACDADSAITLSDPDPEAAAVADAISTTVNADERAREATVSGSLRRLMDLAIQQATCGSWKLEHAAKQADGLLLQVRVSNRQVRAIEVCQAREDSNAFRIIDGVAFSYVDNGTPLSSSDLRHFEAAAKQLQRVVALVARRTRARQAPGHARIVTRLRIASAARVAPDVS